MPTVIALPGVIYKLAKSIATKRLVSATSSPAPSLTSLWELERTLECLDPNHPLLKAHFSYPNTYYDYSQCIDALMAHHKVETI